MANPIATSGIAAAAFELMEQRPISSLADGSAKAQSASRAYATALNFCLEQVDWSWARQVADLSEVATTTAGYVVDDDLPYGYTRPGTAVRIRRVIPKSVIWRADKLFLRANQSGPLRVVFTEAVTDESKLPESFKLAVAYKMATLMPQLVTSSTKQGKLDREAAEAWKTALRADRFDGTPERYDDGYSTGDWASEAVQ